MIPQEQTLWLKIKAFPLEEASASFSFSDRLARENGWTKHYALRVIEEYRKFFFLCCISPTGVTPSDPVDQAWHLHLSYTRSYWVDLCRNTLDKELHHTPTQGGKNEAQKFNVFYTNTLLLYKEKFGGEPPCDIWQDHHTRFTDINFQRVNLQKYWLVKKPSLYSKHAFIVMGIALFALLFIQATLDFSSYIIVGFLIMMGIIAFRNKGKGGDGSGCSTSSCSADSGQSDQSGDSGFSSSGCSGCGGGD